SLTAHVVNVYIIHFFFHCHCTHRDLHSFPTRRSSDLYGRQEADAPEVDAEHGDAAAEEAVERAQHRSVAPERDREVGVVVDNPEDRKSTRLNSSHSQISYAVFCLKKKKKKRVKTRPAPPLPRPAARPPVHPPRILSAGAPRPWPSRY